MNMNPLSNVTFNENLNNIINNGVIGPLYKNKIYLTLSSFPAIQATE